MLEHNIVQGRVDPDGRTIRTTRRPMDVLTVPGIKFTPQHEMWANPADADANEGGCCGGGNCRDCAKQQSGCGGRAE